MDIKIGKYNVLSSGTVIGVVNEPITFTIENLVFEFRFKDNKETKENKLNTELSEDQTKLILNFENFNNSLGTGNIEPMQLATLNGRFLLLNYRVYALTEKSGRMLHYTWLLGDQMKGGEK